MKLMAWIWVIIVSTIVSCNERTKKDDFENSTGITSDEFYEFMNTVYSRRLDTISNNHEKILYANAGKPIKIPFEMGSPTIQPPPATIFFDAHFALDTGKLRNFRIISEELYESYKPKLEQFECDAFHEKIGKYVAMIHLPWYNAQDQTLLIREVVARCPLGYHGPSLMFYRFKKINGQWGLID